MLQQYQQQPDYTPYGGYGVQPNSGYFNYAATESSWYGSPSSVGGSGGDHTLMHGGLSHNSCNTHIGDSAGNFLNHGYHQTTSTAGATSSSAESFAASNNHPGVSGVNMDPMADFLGGHQNMNETDKIIKEESIDWLSTIINNDEVDQQGNRQDLGEGGGGSSGGGGSGNGKLAVGDLPPHKGGQESNGRLPNFHQAFGSTEIGRFSQHEYYEPPKDTDQISGECQGQQGPTRVAGGTGVGRSEEHQQPSTVTFEPPRQQNRRGRTQRGGGQHRRNSKQTRTAVAAAAAAAAAAAQQYVGGYDVTGSTMVTGTGRHQHQMPPYHHHHHDPYGRNQQHAHQRYHHQEYHHHHQQPPPSPSYQHHQQEYYPRPYDRMHHGYQQQQQQQQLLPPQPSTNHQSSYYNNNREQSYTGGGGSYNRFHSCCSTEHSSIARPNHHHNYGGGGPGQYYGDYNTSYSQW
ncbi:Hypothetical protein CINCED_3A018047 [Cinara cedri]|nr:Hypothetical protein CINCED_3A018047 [Cinara cedri]